MSSSNLNAPLSMKNTTANITPLGVKPISDSASYDKENLASPNSPKVPRSKNSRASSRHSLPTILHTGLVRSPFKNRNELPSGSEGPLRRRGRVTDGGATSSLAIVGEGNSSEQWTPKKRLASVAQLDGPQSASKRPRRDNDNSLSSTTLRPSLAHDENGEHAPDDGQNFVGMDSNKLPANPLASHAPLNSRDRLRETFDKTEYPSVDAQFDAMWGAVATRASGDDQIADAFGDDDAFEEWLERRSIGTDQRDHGKGVDRPSQKSGDLITTKSGDLPAEESRIDAVKATAVLEAHNYEAFLPAPLVLASRVYRALEVYSKDHDLVPEIPVPRLSAPASPVVPHQEIYQVESPTDFPVRENAEDSLPPVDGTPTAAPEAQPPVGAEKAGRTLRSARIRSESRPKASLVSSTPSKAPRIAPQLVQKARAGGKATGGKMRPSSHQPNTPIKGSLLPSPFLLSPLESVAEVTAPSNAKTGVAVGLKRPARRLMASNGILGSSVAGPSGSTAAAQDPYSPALAQQIWELIQAGHWNQALGLLPAGEKSHKVTGVAEVQKYLADHPKARDDLRPLTKDGPRAQLFTCRSRTFWVPVEQMREEKERGEPKRFVLERRSEDCVNVYATQDNYNKHVYKDHFKKKYLSYPKKNAAAKVQTMFAKGVKGQALTISVKGKGKARQTKKEPKPTNEDDGAYTDGEDDDE